MKTKQFLISVPMLPEESLKSIEYEFVGLPNLFHVKSRFPSIPLIEWNLASDDQDIRIVAIMTDDVSGRSERNLAVLKEELAEMSLRVGIALEINELIRLPHNETKEKQVEMFRKISNSYLDDSEVYVDITYGTKVMPICTFASLVYAEKVKNAEIKSIIYGKYEHTDSGKGEIYDLRSVYELNMLVNSISAFPSMEIEGTIDLLWGDK